MVAIETLSWSVASYPHHTLCGAAEPWTISMLSQEQAVRATTWEEALQSKGGRGLEGLARCARANHCGEDRRSEAHER
jgi:hypothetical protein